MKRLGALAWGFAALGLLLALPAQAADTVYYYSSDTIHSEVVVTDQNRNVVERTHYAPYGQVLDRDLRDGPGYTGHEEDPETSLVYMQQRYYDPEAGRFLSTDPVQADGGGGSFNRYEYANDNPYRYTDPDGRCADGTCDVMVQNYGAWANAHPAEADKLGREVGVPGVTAMLAITGAPEVVGVAGALRAAGRYIAGKIAGAAVRQAASESARPNGVPKNWIEDKPAKGPGTIYRNPENPKHDTVRVVPGRSESSQPGQQVDHVVRTANGQRYGADNTPVPAKSQESHIPADKFKFVPADKLQTH